MGEAFSRCQDLLAKAAETPGAIGYTELRCGENSSLPMASIRNAAGAFVLPSNKSISEVASTLGSKMTNNFRVSLANAAGQECYPIVSFTWFYVPEHPHDAERRRAINEYLSWVYGPGQELARAQGYTTLPPSVLEKVRAKLATLR